MYDYYLWLHQVKDDHKIAIQCQTIHLKLCTDYNSTQIRGPFISWTTGVCDPGHTGSIFKNDDWEPVCNHDDNLVLWSDKSIWAAKMMLTQFGPERFDNRGPSWAVVPDLLADNRPQLVEKLCSTFCTLPWLGTLTKNVYTPIVFCMLSNATWKFWPGSKTYVYAAVRRTVQHGCLHSTFPLLKLHPAAWSDRWKTSPTHVQFDFPQRNFKVKPLSSNVTLNEMINWWLTAAQVQYNQYKSSHFTSTHTYYMGWNFRDRSLLVAHRNEKDKKSPQVYVG